jgi:glycine cleavage system P protein (glycine dehydrogenase) subunit 1
MSYISLSDQDKKEMLARIGVASVDDLFCCIPEDIRLKKGLHLPPPLTEPELLAHFGAIGRRNREGAHVSFLGAGAYRHHIPYVVDYLSSRGEFISPYTPYQPEVSQGTLQVIFEYQTLICQLTEMEISNASLYDGASAAAEAVLMAERLKGRPKMLIAGSIHPQYREVIRTYVKNLSIRLEEVEFDAAGQIDIENLKGKIDGETSAVVCQSPNFFGVIEKLDLLSATAHEHQALFVVLVSEAASLGLLQAPGRAGADIVAGEGQSLGLPLSFGGPSLGFMACRKDYIRQFPGRIAGETKDAEGKRGFVLTLSTREQHIRREKATSNICTNQAWCALRTTIFLETLGQEGLRELAHQNIQKANYAFDSLSALRGVKRKFGGPVFNEFVLEFPGGYKRVQDHLLNQGIIGGLALESFYPGLKDCALFCVTEVHTRADIDRLTGLVSEVLR